MTDFTDEDEQKAAIRAAIEKVYDAGIAGIDYVGSANYAEREQAARKTLQDSRDSALAALEKPAPVFREGEEIVVEDKESAPYPHYATGVCGKFCRRLRLSEMPQAVDDLRAGMEVFTCNDSTSSVRSAAQKLLDAFDEQIEP